MFPCQPSCEVLGGWLVRMEVTVSPCSTVLGATAVTLSCHSALLRFPAGLPYFPLATIHCPSPLLAVYDLPPTVTPGKQPSPCGGRARCWLWQQVNKMCSQLGVSSWLRMVSSLSMSRSPKTTVLSLIRISQSTN